MTEVDGSEVVSLIEHLHCPDGENLLQRLGPRDPLWSDDPSAWIFRGHSDGEWDLKAKAFRTGDPYKPYGVACPTPAKWNDYADAGRQLLERFRHEVNHAGLSVPTPVPGLQKALRYGIQFGGDPDFEDHPLLALAQHLGLPTPLLDWTTLARVAAYFAAADAAGCQDGPRDMCVWALRADAVAQLHLRIVDDACLTLVSAPRATNPNLHAQSGVFTWSRGERASEFTVDDLVARLARSTGTQAQHPAMRRITCPTSAAPTLLRLLAYEGVTGASMFPGHLGVVRAMKEQALWDRPPPHRDWRDLET